MRVMISLAVLTNLFLVLPLLCLPQEAHATREAKPKRHGYGADQDVMHTNTNKSQQQMEKAESSGLPVVLWHGMGDSCCDPHSMGRVKTLIEDELGVYVYSVQLASDVAEDRRKGFFGNVNAQVEEVCNKIRADPNLSGGYNGIGFSQGGQFMRALVQTCQGEGEGDPKMSKLITFGGQHQGVMEWPGCSEEDMNDFICSLVRRLISMGAYSDLVRTRLVQAQYFKDPFNLKQYLHKNIFLPRINNELEVKNATYSRHIQSLDLFLMFMWQNDTVVVPRESSLFGVYNATTKKVVPLQQQLLYQEDWLGLQSLDQHGKLRQDVIPGDHMQIDFEWFNHTIVHGYLKQ